jgi:hypothetical protein
MLPGRGQTQLERWRPPTGCGDPSLGCARGLPLRGHEVRRNEIALLRMPGDVGGDEGAERYDLQTARPHVGKRGAGEGRAKALPLEVGRDLGVEEDDRAWTDAVGREADAPAAEGDLVAALGGVVAYGRFGAQRLGRDGASFVPLMSCPGASASRASR